MSRFQNKQAELDQLLSQQKFSQALQLSRKLLREKPAAETVWLARSEAERALGQLDDALGSAQRAHELAPHSGFALAQYVRCLLPGADYARLLPLLNKGLDATRMARFESPWVAETLGGSAASINAWPQARAYFQQLVNDEGRRGHYRYMLALSCNLLGDVSEAVRQLKASLRYEPLYGPSHALLLDVAPGQYHDAMAQTVIELSEDVRLDERQRFHFYHARADYCHHQQRWEEAFRWYRRANSVRRAGLGYSVEDDEILNQHLLTLSDQRKPRRKGGRRKQSFAGPVFLVGLPCSGSTLVEQMLVNSGAFAAPGELRDMEVLLASAGGRHSLNELGPEDWASLADLDLDQLRQAYLQRLQSRLREGQRCIDRNPHNYRLLGMILQALPDAAVVHVRKPAIQACLDLYRHQFSVGGSWSCTFKELVYYYRLYQQLMARWHEQFPGRIHELDYEQLLAEPTATLTDLYHYCGLKWSDDLLELPLQGRPIYSVSASRVRRGLAAQPTGDWQHYEPQLNELLQLLRQANLA